MCVRADDAEICRQRCRPTAGSARLARGYYRNRTLRRPRRYPGRHLGGHPGQRQPSGVADHAHRSQPGPHRVAIAFGGAGASRAASHPRPGTRRGAKPAGSRPKDPQAYDLYLHSLAIPTIRSPTRMRWLCWSRWCRWIPLTPLHGRSWACAAIMTRPIPTAARR